MSWLLIGRMKGDFRLDNPKSADDYVSSLTPTAGGECPLLIELLKTPANMSDLAGQSHVSARVIAWDQDNTVHMSVSLDL